MFLGIDLGTSGVKAVVVDDAGVLVGESASPLSVSNPQPLWSEQDPDAWWRANRAPRGPHEAGALGGVGGGGL